MELSYWQSRWRKNNIGWHMAEVYPQLPALWPSLSIKENARVLVPLCGKNLDMNWLAEQGCHVIGVEISQKALEEFISNHPEPFSKETSHNFTIYRSESIELWNGDFLNLPTHNIPAPDLIYDKTSIVALPPKMRAQYTSKVLELCGRDTQILLQTFEYNQDEMEGPPFSVNKNEIRQWYDKWFDLHLLREQSKFEDVRQFQQRGLSSYFTEKVYHLEPLQPDD